MRDIWITMLAPIFWGSTYLVTTEFLPADRPFLAAAMRALPVGIAIVLMTRTYPKGIWWWRAFALGALNIGVFFALLFIAAYRLPGGIVATVGALQPLLVMFLTWLVFHKQPPLLAIGAAGIGIIGVALLVFDPSAQLDAIGVIAAIAAMLSMGAGIVLTKYWGNPVTLMPFTGWQLVAGGIILLPIALIVESLPSALTMENIFGYLWLGLLNTGIGYAIWFRGIKHLQPYQMSFLGLFSPVVAVILGYVFLDQGFGISQWVGIALILSSIVLAQYGVYFAQTHPRIKAQPAC